MGKVLVGLGEDCCFDERREEQPFKQVEVRRVGQRRRPEGKFWLGIALDCCFPITNATVGPLAHDVVGGSCSIFCRWKILRSWLVVVINHGGSRHHTNDVIIIHVVPTPVQHFLNERMKLFSVVRDGARRIGICRICRL